MTEPTEVPTEATPFALDAKTYIDIFRAVDVTTSYQEFLDGVPAKESSIRRNIDALMQPGGKIHDLPHDLTTPITLIFGAVSLFVAAVKLIDSEAGEDSNEEFMVTSLVNTGFMGNKLVQQTFIVTGIATAACDISGSDDRTLITDPVARLLADADPEEVIDAAMVALVTGSLAVSVLDSLGGWVDGYDPQAEG